jgi:hypothetical protein
MPTRKLYISKSLEDYYNSADTISDFIDLCCKELSVDGECNFSVYFVDNRDKHGIKTTAYYDPRDNTIKIYAKGRMLMDSLRSLAHEMTHMMQNEMGLITGPVKDEGGFHEDQANAKAGLIVKRFIKRSGIKF